jgi:hypothetical protein
VSTGRPPAHAAVHWLTAQSLLFGAMAALLGIAANAMFLEAYGSGWLPVTYIAIGIAGVVVSGTIARSAQRFDMMRIAVIVLGGAAVLFAAAWAIAVGGGGAWVSAPLLVLFPVLIQLGFVFIGGQAGRMLDIAGIKASFARIMTGFPVGAVVGGLIAGPLVDLLGQTEDLLVATAICQGAFAALVWATGRRYAALLAGTVELADTSDRTSGAAEESSFRRLFGQRFVALILGYQVLSALGSQVSDFLVFDRAAAQYPSAEDLARFFAGYTAVMNIASIAFLFLAAGPLLRRYGLRLGIAANPLVVTLFAALMILVLSATGGASLALLVVVAATRIADIALTDGTTRTSINAMYQVLPNRSRFAAQAAVEGMGVPIAIAASGVLILVLNTLPSALTAMIAVLAIVCGVWTWTALLLYRAYGPALVDALRRRRLLDPDAELEATVEDAAIARHLLVSGDARSARLGLELASTLDAPGIASELAALADDSRLDVRLAALAGLTVSGDAAAKRRLSTEVRAAATSGDPSVRLRGAIVMGVLDGRDREAVAALLDDEAIAVRVAALDSIQPGDAFAVGPVVRALEDPRSATSGMVAIGRLGDAALPSLATLLEAVGSPAAPVAARMVRAVTTPSPARDEVLRRHVHHRDRELGRLVMDRLAGPGPSPQATAEALDTVLHDDVEHAVRILGAIVAMSAGREGPDGAEGPEVPLRHALDDELALIQERIVASRMARHGRERLGPAIVELAAGGRSAALAVEALEVGVGPTESRLVVPLLDPSLTPAQRLGLLGPPARAAAAPRDVEDWLRDLVEDTDDDWRSAWLRACAIHSAGACGLLGRVDLAPARALGDQVVDEELRVAAGGVPDDRAAPS